MNVRVQFFAQLRDLAGVSQMNVDLADGSRIRDLLEIIYRDKPELLPHDASILTGSGVEFVDRNYKLKPDEEISIMPPVQGG